MGENRTSRRNTRNVTYKIFSEGTDISDKCEVASIVVSKCINKVSSANIQLNDGGKPTRSGFDVSDAGYFDPGKEIRIQVGYMSDEETIFEGIVVRHGFKLNSKHQFILNIECKDKAIKLTVGRKSNLYLDASDSDIIQEILSAYSGITVEVDSTNYVSPELIQNYTTDWDFIIQRAELNGLLLLNSDNKVTITAPKVEEPVLVLSPDDGIIDFNAYMDARNQFDTVKAASWDRENQEVLGEESSSTPTDIGGNISPSDLAAVLELDTFNLQTTSSIPSEFLQIWATGKHVKSGFSKIRGSLTITGTPDLFPGDTIEIEGFSEQFNGKMYVGGIEHMIERKSFTTTIELGIEPLYFNEIKQDIVASATSGLLSPIKGLHIGVVEQIHEDPKGEYRIKVQLPSLQVDNLSVWARQANFYASNEAGLFFYPEIGDEVVVGFFNEDPQAPVILGSMYNKKSSIPVETPAEENYIKSIRTKNKMAIIFDEEKNIITIETNDEGTGTIIMDQDQAKITVTDYNDNIVELSENGISLTSTCDINIKADGDINIEAGGNITQKATKDLTGEGMNVTQKASTQYTAEGAMAELKGSGQTTISGGIVMIN